MRVQTLPVEMKMLLVRIRERTLLVRMTLLPPMQTWMTPAMGGPPGGTTTEPGTSDDYESLKAMANWQPGVFPPTLLYHLFISGTYRQPLQISCITSPGPHSMQGTLTAQAVYISQWLFPFKSNSYKLAGQGLLPKATHLPSILPQNALQEPGLEDQGKHQGAAHHY